MLALPLDSMGAELEVWLDAMAAGGRGVVSTAESTGWTGSRDVEGAKRLRICTWCYFSVTLALCT